MLNIRATHTHCGARAVAARPVRPVAVDAGGSAPTERLTGAFWGARYTQKREALDPGNLMHSGRCKARPARWPSRPTFAAAAAAAAPPRPEAVCVQQAELTASGTTGGNHPPEARAPHARVFSCFRPPDVVRAGPAAAASRRSRRRLGAQVLCTCACTSLFVFHLIQIRERAPGGRQIRRLECSVQGSGLPSFLGTSSLF